MVKIFNKKKEDLEGIPPEYRNQKPNQGHTNQQDACVVILTHIVNGQNEVVILVTRALWNWKKTIIIIPWFSKGRS